MARQLTDGNIEDWTWGSEMGGPLWDKMSWKESYVYGARGARNHYEDLISRGKLRVVKKARLVDGRCSLCDYDAMDRSDNLLPTPHKFCPGCGQPIKP